MPPVATVGTVFSSAQALKYRCRRFIRPCRWFSLRPCGSSTDLHYLMAMLPAPLKPLVIRAFDPAVTSAHSLALPTATLAETATFTTVAADALGSLLTALSFDLFKPGGATRMSGVDAEVYRATAPLACMTALRQLRLRISYAEDGPHEFRCMHALAVAVTRLTGLTALHVQACGHHCGEVAALASLLRTLRMLRSLELEGCGICHGGRGSATWKEFALFACALRVLSALTHLSLARNYIFLPGWKLIAAHAAALPLQSLNLEQCFQDSFDRGCDKACWRRWARLRYLDVSAASGIFEYLPHIVGQLPQLQHLIANNLFFVDSDLDDLIDALLSHEPPRLQVLDIGQCQDKPVTVAALCRGFRGLRDLREVSLAWFLYDGEYGRQQLDVATYRELMPRLAALPRLEALMMDAMRVHTVRDVPAQFVLCTGLTRLEMTRFQTSCEGLREFMRCLARLTALRSLTSSILQILDLNGTCGVEDAVCALVGLSKLSLTGAPIYDSGARRLAQGLTCMTDMRDLRLERVGFSSLGLSVVMPAAATLRALSVLSLADTSMCVKGAVEVARVLPQMSALRTLGLSGCKLTDAGRAMVAQAAPAGLRYIETQTRFPCPYLVGAVHSLPRNAGCRWCWRTITCS